jgi:hypothetical protein
MGYLSVGGKEIWRRFVVPPFSSTWTFARDLVLRRRQREAAGTDRTAKAAERSRRMASWQRSHDQ